MHTPKAQGGMPSPQLQHQVKPSFPFTFQIRSFWVLLSSTVITVAMAAVTYFLIDGFDLTTVNATTLSDDDKSDLLDKYNSYSAAVAGVVSMPLTMFGSSLLPLFFLCYWTKDILNPNKSMLTKLVPMVVGFALAWLLGQGMSALNVQLNAPTYEYIIKASDLMDTTANKTFGLSTSSITKSSHVAGIPSNDTILRNAIRSQGANFSSQCSSDAGPRPSPELSVRANRRVGVSRWRLNKTAQIFTYGFSTLWDHFGVGWNSTLLYLTGISTMFDAVQSSDGAEMLTNMQNYISDITQQLEDDADADTWGSGSWLNISVPDITIEFANFQLSPQIKFESVTFDLPVKPSLIRNIGVSSNATDYSWNRSTADDCNDHACVLVTTVVDATLYNDQIRLLPLCMGGPDSSVDDISHFYHNRDVAITWCDYISNTSVLVFSLAQHISADEVNTSSGSLSVKNPRQTYSITVGRLSWETIDLAEQYGAKCESGSSCDGLYFPLTSGEQHLVLGESQIPKARQPYFASDADEWDVLAFSKTLLYEDYGQGHVFYPSKYNLTADSGEWTAPTRGNCANLLSPYINPIMQNHLYSKDPVQPAYTAAIFWLFQNAVVRDVLASNATMGGASNVRLAFEGNIQWLSSHASIPLTSAIFAFIGIAIVWFLGVFTTVWARSSQKQAVLADNLTVNSVAEMIVGAAQFPPYLVNTRVLASNGSATDMPCATDEFEIDE